jgi:hypothetical protein
MSIPEKVMEAFLSNPEGANKVPGYGFLSCNAIE